MTGSSGGRRAIERCVGDGATFAREAWGRTARLFRRADAAAWADVLTLAAVDELVGTGGLRHPALRVVREGEALPRSSYVTAHTTGGRRVTDAIDPVAVLDAFAEGATIVLQGLHRFVHPVQRFCREIEGYFEHPIQANAYLTPAGSRGLATHHDTHDVLVLQLHGEKRWTLHEPDVRDPVAGYPAHKRHPDPGEPTEVFTLEPGDCLYLPRGVPHRAEGAEGPSLHLTLGIRSPTWHDLLERVLERARELPELRASLPLGYRTHPGELEAGVADALELAADWLRRQDPTEIAAAEIDRAGEGERPRQVGRLSAIAGVDPIDPATRLVRADEVPWSVETRGDHAVLRAGPVVLSFPRRVETALRFVSERSSVSARDLAEHLVEQGALVLLRRLHREGLLRRSDGR